MIFTAYNCGTGHNRYSDDVVAQLYRETICYRMITDGPGSGGPYGHAGLVSKVSALPGLLGGKGVDANVASVVTAVQEFKLINTDLRSGNMVINMCGWSRGAITCIKIANALHADPQTADIPINIFAIDPVPGGSCINNHMWRSTDLTSNIRICNLILSQHDRRRLFAPYYPPEIGPFTDVDIMPGDHSAIVKPKIVRGKPSLSAACELVKDMAKRFLIARGTRFGTQDLLSPPEVLKRYSLIAERFDDYAHFAAGAPGAPGFFEDWAKRFQGERRFVVLDDDNQRRVARMLPVKPQFFLNEHHRTVFQPLFPFLTKEIDLPPERAFSSETSSHWMWELLRMIDDGMTEQSKMVTTYATACQGKRAAGAAA